MFLLEIICMFSKNHEHPEEDMMFGVCPGCGATQLSERMRRCRQCDETMCERCVNEGELCYMCDGAYPGATSSEQGETRERDGGDPMDFRPEIDSRSRIPRCTEPDRKSSK